MSDSTTKMTGRKRALSGYERFAALSDAQKEEVWKECDRGAPFSRTRPLSAAQRQQWERIRKKMGRPIKGKGVKVVSLSVEKGLLTRADRLAKAKGVTRAAMVAAGLNAVLARPDLLDRPAA